MKTGIFQVISGISVVPPSGAAGIAVETDEARTHMGREVAEPGPAHSSPVFPGDRPVSMSTPAGGEVRP